MEIQRVKFLLIASALAAPACVTTVVDENATGTGGSTGSSTGGAQNGTGGRNGGTGGRSTGGNVSHDGGGPSTGGSDAAAPDGSTGGSDGSAGGDGSAGSDGSTGGNPGDGAISDGSVSIDANRPDGNVCDDDTITGGFGDCGLLAADACTYASFQVGQCNDAKTTMKPFIAQQTIQCILDNAAACDPTKTYQCKDAAVHIACPDPTADDECDTIHTACSAVSVDECKQYLSGLKQPARNDMVSCVTGNCSFGLYTCLEGL
jgi:hypothetical protein